MLIFIHATLHTTDKLNELVNLINKKKQHESYKTLIDEYTLDPSGFPSDYGVSYTALSPPAVDCLKEINQRYRVSNIRPEVIDFGAGGHVTAVEKQKATAHYLQKNVMKAKAFLGEGEDVKAICSLKNIDALSIEAPFYKANAFDVSWIGNFIHFLSKQQLENFVKLLYKITKVNGYVFAETE